MSSIKCGVVGKSDGGFKSFSKCTQADWVTARDECMASMPLSKLSERGVKWVAVL